VLELGLGPLPGAAGEHPAAHNKLRARAPSRLSRCYN
jgi:hypothetical protein